METYTDLCPCGFRPPSAKVVSAESFSHGTETLLCLQKEMETYTDLCPCGETQTMFHIVEFCPLTKLNGGLSRLHFVDENAVSWPTSYGGEGNLRPRRPPREYLGEYTS